MKATRFLIVVVLVGLLAPLAFPGEGELRRSDEELKKILGGLEHGIHALRALGRNEEAQHLLRIAKEVGGELERRAHGRERERENPERAVWKRHLEILRLAMPALREGEKRDAAERIEQVMHGIELLLEGRKEEAHAVLERGPKEEEVLEILLLAERLWREFGHPDRAERIEALVREARREAHPREGERREGGEREIVEHRIEVMRLAMKALLEAEKRDLAHRLEQAVHAYELRLKGRRDEEARRVYEAAPRGEQLAEILGHAAHLWEEFGHEGKAATVAKLSREILGRREDRERREGREHHEGGEGRERVEHLERRIAEMQKQAEELRRELEKLRREIR